MGPGPNAKVVFAGQELDDVAFTAFGPIGLYFGVVSYNGNFRAAICCDAECEPYPERLTSEWETAFDRVHQSVMRTPGHSAVPAPLEAGGQHRWHGSHHCCTPHRLSRLLQALPSPLFHHL